jgi:hypothetical protein
MNVMEVIGARMVKGPTEGILFWWSKGICGSNALKNRAIIYIGKK